MHHISFAIIMCTLFNLSPIPLSLADIVSFYLEEGVHQRLGRSEWLQKYVNKSALGHRFAPHWYSSHWHNFPIWFLDQISRSSLRTLHAQHAELVFPEIYIDAAFCKACPSSEQACSILQDVIDNADALFPYIRSKPHIILVGVPANLVIGLLQKIDLEHRFIFLTYLLDTAPQEGPSRFVAVPPFTHVHYEDDVLPGNFVETKSGLVASVFVKRVVFGGSKSRYDIWNSCVERPLLCSHSEWQIGASTEEQYNYFQLFAKHWYCTQPEGDWGKCKPCGRIICE